MGSAGVAGFSGVQRCGSVWSCPACAARIRQERGTELEQAAGAWLDAGGGIEFATLTIPHGRGDDLEQLHALVSEGWRKGVISGRRFQEDRDDRGIVAWCRTVEVTDGQHGWHPHVHVLLFTRRPLSGRARALLGARIFGRWSAWVARSGQGVCSPAAFRMIPGQRGLGVYVSKLQDGSRTQLGVEFTRADLKSGRKQSVTPFEHIEAAFDGDAVALARWWEWERATVGRRCMTWSVGGRGALGLDVERTDQQIVDEDQADEVVMVISREGWRAVVRWPGGEAGLLSAVERHAGGAFLSDLVARAGP